MSLPPEMKEKARLGHVHVPEVFAESCKHETRHPTLNTPTAFPNKRTSFPLMGNLGSWVQGPLPKTRPRTM